MTVVPTPMISPTVAAALRQASTRTGADFDYLVRTAQRESGFKTHIKSNTSSATGLFQFIEQTWLHLVKKAGGAIGLEPMAKAIERTPGGRHKVADPNVKSAILALRKSPRVAAYMAGVFTRENAQVLERVLNRPATSGELYIAHFLGVRGAEKLIKAAETSPKTRADILFPKAASANRRIFFGKSGRPRHVAAVYANLTAPFDSRTIRTASAKASKRPLPVKSVSAPVRGSTNVKQAAATPPAREPARTPGKPLNIVPPALLRFRPGGLFDNLVAQRPPASQRTPPVLASAHFDLLQGPKGADKPSAENAASHNKQGGPGAVSWRGGLRPMLFNLFATGPTRPMV